MGTTFTQAFIEPGKRALGSGLPPTGTPVLRIGDVTLFIEGTRSEQAATLRSIAGAAATLAAEMDPAATCPLCGRPEGDQPATSVVWGSEVRPLHDVCAESAS